MIVAPQPISPTLNPIASGSQICCFKIVVFTSLFIQILVVLVILFV